MADNSKKTTRKIKKTEIKMPVHVAVEEPYFPGPASPPPFSASPLSFHGSPLPAPLSPLPFNEPASAIGPVSPVYQAAAQENYTSVGPYYSYYFDKADSGPSLQNKDDMSPAAAAMAAATTAAATTADAAAADATAQKKEKKEKKKRHD